MSDFQHLCGWAGDHPGILTTAAQHLTFSQAAPGLFGSVGDGTNVLLYRAWKDVLGKYPNYPAQEIGDCTSFGSGHTVDLLACVQISMGKKPEAFKETCTEAIYGMGRAIANMLGGGDGCYGGAVAKAVMQGTVPREAVGSYAGSRAKQWGGRGGVPANIQSLAKDHPIKSTALVTTSDEAEAALKNGYPFIVCSNQGFTMTRDSDGVCQPRGSWAHCLSCSGVRYLNGKRQFLIDQSWGDNTPSGPTSLDQPTFSFWIDDSVLESRMLSDQDSYAFSGFAGFPGQAVPSHWTFAGLA